MSPIFNALGCLLALGCAYYLWRPNSSLYRNGILLAIFLGLFVVFSYAAGDVEYYPFRLMALSLCFSTTALRHSRRIYVVLAQAFWLWVELFGNISLFYRGVEIGWTRLVAIFGLVLCSSFLSRIGREMEFCLMVFWIAVWIFF